jgi:hypothetical protein
MQMQDKAHLSGMTQEDRLRQKQRYGNSRSRELTANGNVY